MNSSRKAITILAALVAFLGGFNSLHAQEYSSKTIRIVVPLAAGGGTDLLAQTIAHELSESMRQSVIVDNRPGAGTQLGAEMVARAIPDG